MVSAIVKDLQGAGINAEDYKRGPFGRRPFAIAIRPVTHEGQVKFWQGEAEAEIFPDKKARQAVLNVDEKKHVIEQVMNFYYPPHHFSTPEEEAIRRFNRRVSLPFGTRRTAKILEQSSDIYDVRVRAHVPANFQSLLLGMDETYHFISSLPQEVSSVEEAHEVLRPSLAKREGTKRQGEWFFVPVSETRNDSLHRYAANHPNRLNSGRLERGSTHMAQQVTYRNKLYAIGYVWDSRKAHHTPMWLSIWHQVVRNNEIPVRINSVTRYWD